MRVFWIFEVEKRMKLHKFVFACSTLNTFNNEWEIIERDSEQLLWYHFLM